MRITIAHHLWRLGGETRFNLDLAAALCELGHCVNIVAVSSPAENILEELGRLSCLEKVYSFVPIRLEAFALIQRSLIGYAAIRAARRYSPDVIWLDSNTYKPLLVRERNYRIVEYIHFPLELLEPRIFKELPEVLQEQLRLYFVRYNAGKLRLYRRIATLLQRKTKRGNPFESADLVVANSAYIAEIVRAIWNSMPEILHPPVHVEEFQSAAEKGFEERDSAVIMIGRIAPEKRYETAIEALARTETKPVLRIVGSLSPSMKPYLQKILKLAKDKRVELELIINAPRKKLVELTATSRIFLHTTVGEHFGIAVVEAMAAGLPVIVHKSGGAYLDIIDKDKYGLSFNTVKELANHIDRLIVDKKWWSKLHDLSLQRSKVFSFNMFKKRLNKILYRLRV